MRALLAVLLLQASVFEGHVRTAQTQLQIAVVPIEVSLAHPMAAWVEDGPDASWRIYVRSDFLREADPLALRSVAYHETCHLYLGNRRRLFHNSAELNHLMVTGCVEWLHGPQFHWVMTSMPCQKWYPYEATRYNRLIGKERCVAKR